MSEVPIACTLDPDQLKDRVALIGRAEIAGGVRARFRETPRSSRST